MNALPNLHPHPHAGPHASPPASPHASGATLLDGTVMVADDEPLLAELIRVHLEERGHLNFAATADPLQVLPLMRRVRPAVLLLDLMMPRSSGFEILARLRTDPQLCRTPVILMTAAAGHATKRRALDLGATDFLAKPLDPSELILRVRNTLASASTGWIGIAPVAAQTEAVPGAAAGDALQPLVSRLAGHPRLAGVVQRFVAQLPARLAAAASALQTQDMHELATIAHWLKGAGGSLGYDEMFEPSRALENAAMRGDAHAATHCVAALLALDARIQAAGRRS